MNDQTGFDVWERMLGDEESESESESGSHAKQRNLMHITPFPGRRVAVFVGLDKSKKETQRRDET